MLPIRFALDVPVLGVEILPQDLWCFNADSVVFMLLATQTFKSTYLTSNCQLPNERVQQYEICFAALRTLHAPGHLSCCPTYLVNAIARSKYRPTVQPSFRLSSTHWCIAGCIVLMWRRKLSRRERPLFENLQSNTGHLRLFVVSILWPLCFRLPRWRVTSLGVAAEYGQSPYGHL